MLRLVMLRLLGLSIERVKENAHSVSQQACPLTEREITFSSFSD